MQFHIDPAGGIFLLKKREDKPPLFLCHFLKFCKNLLKCCIVVMGVVV